MSVEPTCVFCGASDKFRCKTRGEASLCYAGVDAPPTIEADPNRTKLLCGDAISIMRQMEECSVDLAVFDPPYPTISGGSNDKPGGEWSRPSGILTANDGKIFDYNDISPDAYLPELHRVLAPSAHVYLMTNVLGLVNGLLDTVQRHGFKVHNLLPWKKNNATPNRWYMKDVEYTIFARKGPAFSIADCGSKTAQDVFPHRLDWDNVPSPKTHPTEKPVNLMRTFIANSAPEGGLVLDMFMGSGATGVATALDPRNLRFIGIELDPVHCAAAAKRLGVVFEQNVTEPDADLEDMLA